MNEDELSDVIIGAAIDVDRHLGPGLLETACQQCLGSTPLHLKCSREIPLRPPLEKGE